MAIFGGLLKELLQKVGSNRKVRGQKIVFEFVKPYSFIAEQKALEVLKRKNPGTTQGLLEEKKRLTLCLRKGWDSNPRYLSVNTLSKLSTLNFFMRF